jgi:hypothetical protein
VSYGIAWKPEVLLWSLEITSKAAPRSLEGSVLELGLVMPMTEKNGPN